MTLRLSSLFEIHIKRIISSWNKNKKYYKKRNRKDVSRKNNIFQSQRKNYFNGLSDSSDDDSYKENPRNSTRTLRIGKTKNSHVSSQSSKDKIANYSDSESCSVIDSSNSDDLTCKGQSKDEQENGIDSEDSYKPNSKFNHTMKGRNVKNASCDNDLNHSKKSVPEKYKRNYLGISSSNSENEKQYEGRVIRARQKKSSMYNKLPSTSRGILTDTDNSQCRYLRSGLHNKENEDCFKNPNCRPTRLNSRKKYMEQKKSDEEKSQEVFILMN